MKNLTILAALAFSFSLSLRAHGAFVSPISTVAPVQSVNGLQGGVVLTTDEVDEGSTNLYHTVARARAAMEALPFDETVTITRSSAGTPVVLISAGDVATGKKVYVQGWKIESPSPWGGATDCSIQDTAAASFANFDPGLDFGSNILTTSGGSATDAFWKNTGGGDGEGLQFDCDANGSSGSDVVITVFGVIK
jgi:hypothetical protein